MSFARSGDLICDCCGRIVIKAEEVNDKNRKENTGQMICASCWKICQTLQPETD